VDICFWFDIIVSMRTAFFDRHDRLVSNSLLIARRAPLP
jgi:hypothetical protein